MKIANCCTAARGESTLEIVSRDVERGVGVARPANRSVLFLYLRAWKTAS